MNARLIACSALAATLLVSPSMAQQATPPTRQPQPPAAAQTSLQAQELYHVHFVKAAPGKISELISAYQEAPVAQGEPGPPVILRHLQGDDWDLLVLTPLGKDETITTATTPEEQRSIQRMRGLTSQHVDTFTSGPPWADVRATLLGDAARPTGTAGGAAGTIYTVTTYRSIPGHRDQLADTLRRIAGLYPDRRTTMQHIEGAPWEFVMLSRYDSWAALGEDQAPAADKLRSQGFASNEAIGLELRQHVAEHRDTIAQMVTTAPKAVR